MKGLFDDQVRIVLYFAENPHKYFTAKDIREKFNLVKDPRDWPTYGLLTWLVRAGYLLKGPNRKGFTYKRQNAYEDSNNKIRAV